MTARAAPAKFAPDPRRRSLLAKVHLAKKQLGLIDDDYRAILLDVAGRTSAADCSEAELIRALDRFKDRGFAPIAKDKNRAHTARGADHSVARKARAMWISLYHLNAVSNPSEQALEAFACRQLRCEKFQWADQGQGFKLIEALKAMASRAGWQQDDLPRGNEIYALKHRLCLAILGQLKKATVVPRTWTLDDAAFRLLGVERSSPAPWAMGDFDVIARGLGEKLREWRA